MSTPDGSVVCLTGDVHHMSMETRDQSYLGGTEVDAAVEYARIAGHYDLPVTLFVTGRAVIEETEAVEILSGMPHVELGGHNYWAFDTPLHTLFRGLTGSWNGPRCFQSWEISRTLDAFAKLGVDVRSWRDHAYRHDSNTLPALAEHGITHFSDAVEPAGNRRITDDMTIVPINTPPDHEHVYHGFRTPAFVEIDEFEGPFGTESVEPAAWSEWVLERIADHDNAGRTATILAHPACMRIADDMNTFEGLCERLAADDYTVQMMKEL